MAHLGPAVVRASLSRIFNTRQSHEPLANMLSITCFMLLYCVLMLRSINAS